MLDIAQYTNLFYKKVVYKKVRATEQKMVRKYNAPTLRKFQN